MIDHERKDNADPLLPKEQAIDDLVNRIVEGFGAYVVALKVNRQGNRTFVKILIATDEGIGLDQIAAISRAIRDDSAFNELLPENFQLEVSSPGIDYPLKTVRDFHRNLGREMNIFHRSADFKSPLRGKLQSVDDERLIVETGNGSQVLTLTEVEFAKVIIQW
jgi:ribosome maturation factor RimP